MNNTIVTEQYVSDTFYDMSNDPWNNGTLHYCNTFCTTNTDMNKQYKVVIDKEWRRRELIWKINQKSQGN